ncbi:MAG: hypothetical protein SFZ03_02375 [Candidatus Melainabacteria bacterium]|nr:hypothetical protein [Candidatus Melainabacteria bacterium]
MVSAASLPMAATRFGAKVHILERSPGDAFTEALRQQRTQLEHTAGDSVHIFFKPVTSNDRQPWMQVLAYDSAQFPLHAKMNANQMINQLTHPDRAFTLLEKQKPLYANYLPFAFFNTSEIPNIEERPKAKRMLARFFEEHLQELQQTITPKSVTEKSSAAVKESSTDPSNTFPEVISNLLGGLVAAPTLGIDTQA